MNYENFTIKTQEALQEATSIANKLDNAEVGTAHMLQALLDQQDGLISPIVERIGVPSVALLKQVRELIETQPKVSGVAQVYLSSSMHRPNTVPFNSCNLPKIPAFK